MLFRSVAVKQEVKQDLPTLASSNPITTPVAASPIVASVTPTPTPVPSAPPVESKPAMPPVSVPIAEMKKTEDAPKIVTKVGGMMGISLSSIGKPKVEAVKEDDSTMVVEKANAKVEEADMQHHWMEFAARFNKSGGHQIYTTLIMNKPTMIGENEIELIIHNKAQDIVLQEEKQEILDYLREKLNNDHLNLITRIVDLSGSKELLTSPKDKYRVMMKQNPAIDELRLRLGLELDY